MNRGAVPVSRPLVFLDTNALFAGIWSEKGGGRMLLKLGEAGAVRLVVGRRVLAELDDVLRRKTPGALAGLAVLLERSQVEIGPEPKPELLQRCQLLIRHPGDAQILAEAAACGCHFLASLDQAHILNQPALAELPFRIGTPGDCLDWLRSTWKS